MIFNEFISVVNDSFSISPLCVRCSHTQNTDITVNCKLLDNKTKVTLLLTLSSIQYFYWISIHLEQSCGIGLEIIPEPHSACLKSPKIW